MQKVQLGKDNAEAWGKHEQKKQKKSDRRCTMSTKPKRCRKTVKLCNFCNSPLVRAEQDKVWSGFLWWIFFGKGEGPPTTQDGSRVQSSPDPAAGAWAGGEAVEVVLQAAVYVRQAGGEARVGGAGDGHRGGHTMARPVRRGGGGAAGRGCQPPSAWEAGWHREGGRWL